ncbi:hypothetical protein H257_07309 [Aphanomyces astaci]|uniref:MULE transposase domain-containing protein n=1 Tax=Aphanomyces astaci TaxID=112090 RepID=W4GJP9_APHAT|nr:hypothetical protein H257_07309 [Aphanomyces astaci]ETV79244.1 hypothetical protein H257_07309 [Aphanomyces astaci]|eukprot:XP_009831085.1 hypothetical protein H257_07309 [Aphanomyces astaci]
MWVFLATMDSARVYEFWATLREYGITHKNVIKCNMDHDVPDLSLAKHHVMAVTLEIKNALATWIDDDPKHNSNTLFKMLKASIGQESFDGMSCPTLKQVQHAVHYMRSKDLLQKSTVPAAIEELMKWRLTDNIEDQVVHKPFVFGVEEEAGSFKLGDGGMQAFRVGLSTVDSFESTTLWSQPTTTFSTNVLGYPMFVFGYSDMAGSFHLLFVCITSQRAHADVAWLHCGH